MDHERTANLLGALATGLSDEISGTAQRSAGDTGPEAPAVVLIGSEPGISIDRLRLGLGLSHPGGVRLIDRLVSDGLVERRRAAADGRRVELALTPRGQALRQVILFGRGRMLKTLLEALSPAERDQLAVLVEKMMTGLLRDERHAYAICRFCDEQVCVACPIDAELSRRSMKDR